MSVDLATLTALAQAATPGPWKLYDGWTGDDKITRVVRIGNEEFTVFQTSAGRAHDIEGAKADFEYLAACSPDVILALVNRIKELEAQIEK